MQFWFLACPFRHFVECYHLILFFYYIFLGSSISMDVEMEPNNFVRYVLYRLNQRSSTYAFFLFSMKTVLGFPTRCDICDRRFAFLKLPLNFCGFWKQCKFSNTFFQLMWTYFDTTLSLLYYFPQSLPKCNFNGMNLLTFKEITRFYHLLSYSVLSGSEPHPTITQNPRIHLHLMVVKLPTLCSLDPFWKEAC